MGKAKDGSNFMRLSLRGHVSMFAVGRSDSEEAPRGSAVRRSESTRARNSRPVDLKRPLIAASSESDLPDGAPAWSVLEIRFLHGVLRIRFHRVLHSQNPPSDGAPAWIPGVEAGHPSPQSRLFFCNMQLHDVTCMRDSGTALLPVPAGKRYYCSYHMNTRCVQIHHSRVKLQASKAVVSSETCSTSEGRPPSASAFI